MNDLAYLFLSIEGRITRKLWWISQIAIWSASLITMWMYKTLGFHDAIFGGIVTVCLFVVRMFVNIKRWRDRGKRHPILCVLIAEIPVFGWIWGIVELGFLPSEEVKD